MRTQPRGPCPDLIRLQGERVAPRAQVGTVAPKGGQTARGQEGRLGVRWSCRPDARRGTSDVPVPASPPPRRKRCRRVSVSGFL